MAVTFQRTLFLALAASLAACATGGGSRAQWAAHGYLTPGANGDPEIIGAYDSEAECRAAVEAWMSRQVVGNPVSGECLPVDRY
ncbi:MAG: hypothetical protein U5J99_03215 [Parvularculaceae bacterium]|nr:hypothetical protein [Parvularculaceae bacterium]